MEALAKRGNKGAIQLLQSPEYPSELEYLREWALELHGRCGYGQAGLMPLSHSEIRAWKELRGVEVEPHEVQALLQLDSAMLYPGDDDDS